VWDFVSEAEAVRRVRHAHTAQAAADALVLLASERSWKPDTGFLKDDATCVVVDLNPSQRTYEPAVAAGCGSACVVS